MKISNLRIERHDGQSFLTVDIEAKYTSANTLWFSVPSEYEGWLTDDVYDAFLVAAIYPSMFYNEPIEIEGPVSHKLYFNCSRYIQHIVKAYRPEMHLVNISTNGYKQAAKQQTLVGAGFSAGIDSFATFIERFENEQDEEYKISALFFFNVGSHGGGGDNAEKVFRLRYEYIKPFADQKDLPFIPMDSNLFDFYQFHWEFDAGQLCRSAAILVFQKSLSKYFLSSDYSYKESMFYQFNPNTTSLSEIVENFANPMLSTEGLEVITDGGQYSRIEKTKLCAGYPEAQKLLNVCVNPDVDNSSIKNCGRCHKCIRTLVALDSIGVLDNFSEVFNLDSYYKNRFKYKCYLRRAAGTNAYIKENVEFAKISGKPFPNLLVSNLVMFPIRISRKIRKFLK